MLEMCREVAIFTAAEKSPTNIGAVFSGLKSRARNCQQKVDNTMRVTHIYSLSAPWQYARSIIPSVSRTPGAFSFLAPEQ